LTQETPVENIIATNTEELVKIGEKMVKFLGRHPFAYVYFPHVIPGPPDLIEECQLDSEQPYSIVPGEGEDNDILSIHLDTGDVAEVYIDHTRLTFYHNEGRIIFTDIDIDKETITDKFILKK
jgi:hypothetical protein